MGLVATASFTDEVGAVAQTNVVTTEPDAVNVVAYFSNPDNPSLVLDFTSDFYALADFSSTKGTLEAS